MTNLEILQSIKNSKSVCIIGHIDPDADALASMTVLKDFLVNEFKIKQVDIFAEVGNVQENCKKILKGHVLNPEICSYDTAVALDSPNIDRLGKYSQLFLQAEQTYIIDHHDTNTYFAKFNIVEHTSSTAEIIYNLLEQANYNFSIQNLENVYAGIITDTNNFTTPSVNSSTFKTVSKFVDKIKFLDIYNNHFANFSASSMKLLSRAIENAKFLMDNKILISHLTEKDFEKSNANVSHTTGIINKLATTSGNLLTCLIYPKNQGLYVSMRAKNGFDVAEIARRYNGGGHKGASGFIADLPLEKIEELITQEFLNKLKNF